MKKVISLILCLTCMVAMFAGCSNNKKNEDTAKEPSSNITENTGTKPENESTNNTTEPTVNEFEEPDNSNIDDGSLYFGLNGANGESVRLMIPKTLEPHCYPKYSSHFEEGWIKVTISAKDENHDMFTIYASSNDSYKEFENEKNYKVLCDDGVFTVIWFEYELSNISPDAEESVEMIKQNFTLLQESVVIRATEH